MDPEATLDLLLEAIANREPSDIVSAAHDLSVWILRGGFSPANPKVERDTLRARIAPLEAQTETETQRAIDAERECDTLRGALADRDESVEDLRAERDTLRAALQRYGAHESGCPAKWAGSGSPVCSCGLANASLGGAR